jgi:hypothetical protein
VRFSEIGLEPDRITILCNRTFTIACILGCASTLKGSLRWIAEDDS